MTTSLVMSVTDELIAELEAIRKDASDLTPDSEAQEYLGNLAARLLAERAELKRDAERLEFMMNESCVLECMNGTVSPVVYRLYWHGEDAAQSEWYPSKREAIDAARSSAT